MTADSTGTLECLSQARIIIERVARLSDGMKFNSAVERVLAAEERLGRVGMSILSVRETLNPSRARIIAARRKLIPVGVTHYSDGERLIPEGMRLRAAREGVSSVEERPIPS